ncbi:hypothetical protein SAMN04515674_106279 [Pseudarcicella hirudinis]|uniref:Uncharacterized protein n=1 Tax=Pseudarcicella hirudinis TaxID=1079859 RepID=A0A1I5TYU1_9BACT|nr:DsrE family protein [Pseudarcicella hirudinis]SFP88232.1 hypothetical protein SAMN04515674_106279 [Pseudarcicella hirudinis]
MKKILFLGMLMSIGICMQSYSQSPKRQHQIVFHLASPDTLVYRTLTKQLSNVLEHWPEAKIEVVVHSKGLGFMRNDQSNVGKEIESLSKKGIVFAVCENSMKQQKLKKEQIYTQAVYVPVGLAELVLKQEEGWSYIKAGF